MGAPGPLKDPGHPSRDPDPSDVKPLPGAAAFLGMGTSAAVLVAVGVVLGLWGDNAWHTSPILLMVGIVLGLAAAVASVVTQIRKYL